MYKTALAAALIVVLSACDQPANAPSTPLSAEIGTIHYAYAPPPASTADHRERAVGSHEDRLAVQDILDSSANWREADQRIRAFLDEGGLEPVRSARRTQTAGVSMLRLLSADSPDAERAEAIAYYVRELNQVGSPEAVDLDRAVLLLEEHWSDGEVKGAQAAVAQNAEAYVTRSVETGRASSDALAAALAASESAPHDVFEARIQRVADRLQGERSAGSTPR